MQCLESASCNPYLAKPVMSSPVRKTRRVELPVFYSASQLPDLCDCKSPLGQYLGFVPGFDDVLFSDSDSDSSAMTTSPVDSLVASGAETHEPEECPFFQPVTLLPRVAGTEKPEDCKSNVWEEVDSKTWQSIPQAVYFTSQLAYCGPQTCRESDAYCGELHCAADSGNRRRKPARKAQPAKDRFTTASQQSVYHDVSKIDCERQLVELASGGEAQAYVLAELRGKVRSYTLHYLGCRVLQKAIELCGHDAVMDLVAELRGFVSVAISSRHGNYVVQKVVQALPAKMSAFVAEELKGVAVQTACSQYGCRVLCRLLEHAAEMPSTMRLVDEALCMPEILCWHEFGHHIAEAILEHGTPEHKKLIGDVLCVGLYRYAEDWHASFVLETALKRCPPDSQQALVSGLLEDHEWVLNLAHHLNGFRVVRGLVSPGVSTDARQLIQQHVWQLKKSQYGVRVLNELKLAA